MNGHPHGTVPGDGITLPSLSGEPLATEGEATPGPDDYNPFEDFADARDRRAFESEVGAMPRNVDVDPAPVGGVRGERPEVPRHGGPMFPLF